MVAEVMVDHDIREKIEDFTKLLLLFSVKVVNSVKLLVLLQVKLVKQ